MDNNEIKCSNHGIINGATKNIKTKCVQNLQISERGTFVLQRYEPSSIHGNELPSFTKRKIRLKYAPNFFSSCANVQTLK